MTNLEILSRNDSFLKTKIALMTFHKVRYSGWFEKVLLVIEYLQLMSQGLFLHLKLPYAQSQKNQLFSQIIVYFLRLINPCELFSFRQDNTVIKIVLLILFGLTVLKYLLAVYILCITLWTRPPSNMLIYIWKFIFKLQSRVICFFVTSFWTKTILSYYTEDFSLYGMSNSVTLAICIVLIIIEYTFSFFLEIQFCYVLPTKSFLASKSYGTQLMTLIQKLTLQAIQLILLSHSQTNLLVFSSVNLIFSAIKQYMFYNTLPLYNLKALLYQVNLMSLVTSLNLACFVQAFLVKIKYEMSEDMNTIIILWIILALLTIKFSSQMIQRRILSLNIENNIQYPPHVLIHKISASRQLKKYLKTPGTKTKKYDITYLLSALENSNKYLSNMDFQEELIRYVENISSQFPRDHFIKIYLAYLCAKSPNLCFKSIKIIAELKRKSWSKSHLSALILLQKIQKTISLSNQENKEDLNISEYIQSQVYIEKLKKEMLNETDLKIKICSNILSETCNIGIIQISAQLIHKSKKNIDKKISLVTKEIPDSFIEPLLLGAGYHLILNYSNESFKKFSDLWTQKLIKYNKSFQEATLNNENLYQETNAFLVLSGEKHTNGQIVYYSRSLQNICGGQRMSYQGSHVSTLFTPSFQPFLANSIKQIAESGQRDLGENIKRAYIHHKDGYMVEVELLYKIHPYLARGLYLDILIRPVPKTQEYLLIKENGDIEGATKKISKTFGINTLEMKNIKMLSKELYKANTAINTVFKTQQKENSAIKYMYSRTKSTKSARSMTVHEEDSNLIEYDDAVELYRAYSSEGKLIGFSLLNNQINSLHYYHCQIDTLIYGSVMTKVVKLTERAVFNYDDSFSPRHKRTLEGCRIEDNILYDDKPHKDSPLGSENVESEGNENLHLDTDNCNKEFKTDANLLLSSSRSPRIPLMASEREKNTLTQPIQPILMTDPIDIRAFSGPQKLLKIQELPSVSQEFQSSHDQRVYKVFQTNIATKTYPKSFRPLCITFYFVILIALVSLTVLKTVSDDTMNDLLLKKSLLNYSQLRSYKADLIVVNYFAVVTKLLDPLKLVNRGAFDQPLVSIIKNANTHEAELKKYNQMIFNGLAPLAEPVKQKLLAKDVIMNGTFLESRSSAYTLGTSFDAIDMVISAMHQLTYLPNYNSTAAFELSQFIITNVLNGFLYKSAEIINIFVDSVRVERESLQTVTSLVIIVTPLLLAGIALMLTMIIYHQYSITKKQLLAFITLDAQKVKDIMASFNNFKKILTGDDFSGDKFSINNFSKISIPPQDLQERSYRKQNKDRKIEYKEIKKEYSGYFFKVIFYILVLIGIIIWNYVSTQNLVNIIYRRQNQLEFAHYISEMISTNYLSTVSITVSNNTYNVKHLPPLNASTIGLAETKTVRSQLLEVFQELDGTYDPRIKTILLDHRSCKNISYPVNTSQGYCTTLEKNGYLVDLVSVLTVYESLTYNKIQDYNVNCNKSDIIGLLNCAYLQFSIYLPSFVLSAVNAQMIGTIVGDNLEQSVSEFESQQNLLLGVFSVSLVVVSLLTWFQIMKRLREIHNEFKKVLQVFPPTFVLSSFLLKTFLQQKSKNYLFYAE